MFTHRFTAIVFFIPCVVRYNEFYFMTLSIAHPSIHPFKKCMVFASCPHILHRNMSIHPSPHFCCMPKPEEWMTAEIWNFYWNLLNAHSSLALVWPTLHIPGRDTLTMDAPLCASIPLIPSSFHHWVIYQYLCISWFMDCIQSCAACIRIVCTSAAKLLLTV